MNLNERVQLWPRGFSLQQISLSLDSWIKSQKIKVICGKFIPFQEFRTQGTRDLCCGVVLEEGPVVVTLKDTTHE